MEKINDSNKMYLKTLVCIVVVSFCMQLFFVAGTVSAKEKEYTLTLQFTNLADPGTEHYEGWLIVDGSPVSTGKFTVDANGNILDLEGNTIDRFSLKNIDIEMATDFVLSLEPAGDTDTTPSAIKPLAGTLSAEKDSASLTYNIGIDLSSIAGEYILATPTDDAEADDFYLDLEFINLANLTSGHYEGWLIVNGAPISTGKFKISDSGEILDHTTGQIMTDSFLITDLDIANMTSFVLSIEPEGDTDSVPGTVKPMAGDVNSTGVAGAIGHNIAADFLSIAGEYILATPTDDAEADDYYLDLEFINLANLSSGHYEGWLIVNGAPISTGKFKISDDGDILDHTTDQIMTDPFYITDLDIANMTKFVLSIESEGDTDSVPGIVKPMAGDVNSTGVAGAIFHNIAADFSGIAGEYILATPTNNVISTDYDLGLEFTNLMQLTSGHYEGWLIVSGAPVSTGKFNISGSGEIVDHITGTPLTDPFLVADLDITNVTDFVLSVEPDGDTDSIPAAIKPMAGAYDSGTMNGSLSHNIGVDLSSISGEYILATPTDDPAGNELSGVWFLNTTGPAAGLTLPDLSGTDWIYEGWGVISGIPVTTGRFNMSNEADDFDGYSHTNNSGPPFPGEDFILNAPGAW
jgi:hypothetical protein